jgi:dihydrofolate reductase/thymidylate synthase
MTFDVVVAADESGGIGKQGNLPWRLPGDTAFFKRITSETQRPDRANAVIMGRKTWETIPPRFRPLEGRVNVVLTRQSDYRVPAGVLVAASLEDALQQLGERDDIDRAFVIGGAEIYRLAIAMPECRRVYLTRVEGRHDADAFFPPLPDDYQLTTESPRQQESSTAYTFQTWEKGVRIG